MTGSFDAVVVGLGATGAAALRSLARRGASVLGVDRFHPPHTRGSSHGETRIIRRAYFEHPLYVPMVDRAWNDWVALEEEADRSLLTPTPALMVGPREGALVSGARASALEHSIPFGEWNAGDRRGQPAELELPPGFTCLEESRAGILRPEACMEALLESAGAAGSHLRFSTTFRSWEPGPAGGVMVELDGPLGRERIHARRLILSAGPWTPGILTELAIPFEVERQIFFWFQPRDRRRSYRLGEFPVVLWEGSEGGIHYVIPDVGSGVKAALHHQGTPEDPDQPREKPLPGDLVDLRAALDATLPGIAGEVRSFATCMYTNLPDHQFLLDHHPDQEEVVLASPCSGHGFKFAPVLGELVADLATGSTPRFPLDPFRLDRPALRSKLSAPEPGQAP